MKKVARLIEGGFSRLRHILELLPMGRSTWWKGVKSGRFPKPIKLSPNITAWRNEDIEELLTKLNNESIKKGGDL